MHSLLIIIPHWHGAQYLPACLQSIGDSIFSAPVEVEVLVVHNGGQLPDDSEIPTALKVEILRTKEDLGFARAVNVGLHTALARNFEFLCILNQDAALDISCLQNLIEFCTPGALCTPLVMDETIKTVPSWYADKYYPDIDVTNLSQMHSLSLISGVCVFGHSSTFRQAGFFDVMFPMYYEDDDYFTRFRMSGGQLLLITSARVGHVFGSTEPVQQNSILAKRSGLIRFLLRHGTWNRLLRKLIRHYGSCLKRFDLVRASRYLNHDLSMIPRMRYLRKYSHDQINALAMKQCAEDSSTSG